MNTTYCKDAEFLLKKIEESDAVLVGAASGMSAADGKRFWYENDEEYRKVFGPFWRKYGVQSAFDAFYYPYATEEEQWALRATAIHHLYESKAGQVYKDLKVLLKDKPYHIMTTNQDFLFTQDFPEDKISAIQGDWRYFQRKDGKYDRLFPNKEMVDKMYAAIDESGTRIPSDLIPRDPEDGMMLQPWLRHPGFLEGSRYEDAYRRIREFIDRYKNKKILFLELGVGRMTPMFIQEPFWQLTYQLPQAYYISINPKDAILPRALEGKGRAMREDIAGVFRDAVELKEEQHEERKEGDHDDHE